MSSGARRAVAGGRRVPIHRADYTFRAVALPAGATTVEFVYQPASVRIGLLVSLSTVAALAFVGVRERRRTSTARHA